MPPGTRRYRLLAGALGLAILVLAAALAYSRWFSIPHGPGPTAPAPSASLDPAFGDTNQATQAITALLAERQAAVHNRDRSAFMATVDPQNATFLVEQRHWFDDAAQTVDSYTLTLKHLGFTAKGEALARLAESFQLKDGSLRNLEFTEVYRLRPEGWRDSDYAFTELHKDHVVVLHWDLPGPAEQALQTEADNLNWLERTFQWQPTSDIIIKLYPDRPAFLYSIKPSLPGWVAGWTESGESIKYWVGAGSAPAADALLHESTHHMLSELSNDNAAYWLQEGLATWVTATHAGTAGPGSSLLGPDRRLPWTLPELEAVNLEQLDQRQASDYYAEAYLAVKYMLATYGIDKFKAVTAELAKHPANPVTASEKLAESGALTRDAISKALGIPYEQFARDWYRWVQRGPQ